MPDDRHHRERQHDERYMTVPAMPGSGLVVIKAELVLSGFEAVLDRPAVTLSSGLYQPALRLTHVGDSQTDKTLNQWCRAYGGHDHGISDRFAG